MTDDVDETCHRCYAEANAEINVRPAIKIRLDRKPLHHAIEVISPIDGWLATIAISLIS